MGITDQEWAMVKQIVPRAIRSSLACSIASLNGDGTPHVTPIGSFLPTAKGHGTYFDAFNAQLSANVDRDPRVTILAVDSGAGMWGRSFLRGRFVLPPGIRLVATVGPRRSSTEAEVGRFHRMVGPLLRTRGGQRMWRDLPYARDVTIERVIPIRMGSLTKDVGVGSMAASRKVRTS